MPIFWLSNLSIISLIFFFFHNNAQRCFPTCGSCKYGRCRCTIWAWLSPQGWCKVFHQSNHKSGILIQIWKSLITGNISHVWRYCFDCLSYLFLVCLMYAKHTCWQSYWERCVLLCCNYLIGFNLIVSCFNLTFIVHLTLFGSRWLP